MRRAWITLMSVCLMVLAAVPTMAQNQTDVPVEVEYALLGLNTELGTDLTLDDLANYSWQQYQFSDGALGCPQPDQAYTQALTNGYQVLFTYEGTTYDYRVQTGSQIATLCRASDTVVPLEGVQPVQPVEQPVQPVEPVQPTPIQPVTECPDGLPIRLSFGQTARTTPQLGSNIRAEADLNAEDIGTIPESTLFTIVDGPVCGNGLVWWYIDYNGTQGWTAQGQNGLYYVEPIPAPLPITEQPIIFGVIDDVTLLTQIEGNLLGEVSWSPDGRFVAIADASTSNPAVWLYNTQDLSLVPRLIEVSFDTTAMEFSPDGIFLAIGDPDGNIHFVNLQTLEIENSILAHDSAVLDIDFSPDGRYMVSVDDDYVARFFGVPTP